MSSPAGKVESLGQAALNPPQAARPRRLRFAGLVFLFVYPLVTGMMMVVMPLTAAWPTPARTLVMVPLIVLAMVFVIIPFIQTRLRHLL